MSSFLLNDALNGVLVLQADRLWGLVWLDCLSFVDEPHSLWVQKVVFLKICLEELVELGGLFDLKNNVFEVGACHWDLNYLIFVILLGHNIKIPFGLLTEKIESLVQVTNL